MDLSRATPRPWRIDKDNPTLIYIDDTQPFAYLASFDSTIFGFDGADDEAYAQQAVVAVNAFGASQQLA